MTTCGMYNAAGDWVTEVGLPAKSGVGGGILAVLPGQLGLAVFSPRLDEHGNSVRGVQACRRLSKDLELHFMHVTRAARSAVRASYDVVENPSRRRRSPQEQQVLLRCGRRARVYELHGDLLFAGAESVIREITERAGDLDVIVLDVRGIDDTAAISKRLLLGLRDELRRVGGEAVLVDPAAVAGRARSRCQQAGQALSRCQRGDRVRRGQPDRPLRRSGEPDHAASRRTNTRCWPVFPMTQLSLVRSRLLPRTYRDGEALVLAGQHAEGLYLVLSGHGRRRCRTGRGSPPSVDVHRGDHFRGGVRGGRSGVRR